MPRLLLTCIILFLFFLEGTVLPFLSPSAWGLSWMTVPRFALVGVIIVALSLGRREALFYGMLVGFLQDIMFGQIIGVCTLSMMVAGYFSGLILLVFQRSIAVVAVTMLLVLFGHEWILYSLFRLFYASPVDVQWMVTMRILPTVGLNVIFGLLVYVPFMRLCEEVKVNKENQHE